MLYHRISDNVFFILPTVAVGIDADGQYFFEIAWFNVAIGLGSLND